MDTLTVLHRPADEAALEALKLHRADDADIGRLVAKDTIVRDVHGEVRAVYLRLPASPELEAARGAMERIRYVEDYRTRSLKTRSRTVGYLPRVTLRRDFCTTSGLASESPRDHAAVCELARAATALYARHLPEQHARHVAAASKIRPEYLLAGGPFTSGIINDNNPLQYHFDSGNLKGQWSAMFGFRCGGAAGGHLACPELLTEEGAPVGFEVGDRSLLLFDGQGLLHGVTPIQLPPSARRFTVVFYSLRDMWRCQGVDEELARIRAKRTERERRRAAGGYDPYAVKPRGGR